MSKRIICFSLGLSEEDIEKGRASFYSLNKEAPALEMIAISKSMLGLKVADVLADVFNGSGLNAAKMRKDAEDQIFPELYKYRVVVVLAEEREEVLKIMRSFKAALPDSQNIIFAVITKTALTWTFGDYIGHLGKEHEYMKNRNPGK